MSSQPAGQSKSLMQSLLDGVEAVGNKVPHPVVIFLILIGTVLVLGHVLWMAGAKVTTRQFVAEGPTQAYVFDESTQQYSAKKLEQKYVEKEVTTSARTLLSADGIRFMYVGLIPNFMGFTAVGLLICAMIGAGVAEESGLVNACIRKLVIVSPAWTLTYILTFVGILSSVAADAGYLVLIPLAGTAFLSVGRHPLAGVALGFAAVAGAFTVNMLIKPLDAVLVDITNASFPPGTIRPPITLTSNVWFSLASVPFLTVVIGLINERIIEPRLGPYRTETPAERASALTPEESRGLVWSLLALVGVLAVFGLLTIPPGAPLRNPDTNELIGNSPFMNGLIAVIMILFLATGAAYGFGAGTMKSSTDVINAITKAVSGLGGTIFLFFVISQFIAYFNYSNIPTLLAVTMADFLKTAQIGELPLLVGFIIAVWLLDLIFTAAIAKWAIFAPVFIPLFITLNVDPAVVLAGYRIGDSPPNAISPLNAYFALVVGFMQKYDKNAGIGTVVALMLPYLVGITVLWTLFFIAWYLLRLPWGF